MLSELLANYKRAVYKYIYEQQYTLYNMQLVERSACVSCIYTLHIKVRNANLLIYTRIR